MTPSDAPAPDTNKPQRRNKSTFTRQLRSAHNTMHEALKPSRLAGLIIVLTLVSLPGACSLASTPTPVPFTNQSFKVPAGTEHKIIFNLPAGATVEYRFQSSPDIDVRFEDPNGNRLASLSRAYSGSGGVTVYSLGTYALVFDNSFSPFTGKDVNLTYRAVGPGGR